METVSHHERTTAYRQTQPNSAGPTLLYVHGSGGSHQVWVHQYAPTGPSHPAVALDLSGHGESTDIQTPPGPETLAAYAEDVAAVAEATQADVLVGNSLGGAVVFEVILGEYYDPAGAIFAGSGAKLSVHDELRTLLENDFSGAVEQLHEPGLLLAQQEADLVEQSKATLEAAGQTVTQRDFLTCHEFDVREALGDISVPSLAVVGTEDGLTPPSYHEYLAQEIPACDFQTVPEAGHLAMLERPVAFNDAVATFVTENVA